MLLYLNLPTHLYLSLSSKQNPKPQTMKSTSKLTLSLSLLLPLLISASPTTTPSDFIKTSCSATRYPALCVESLSAYAPTIRHDPHHLAQAALSVSINHAMSAHAFVTRLARSKGVTSREAGAVRDCVENMSDSVDRLARSFKELAQAGRPGSRDFAWRMSNVQTWVSAALTDESSCVDGFAGSSSRAVNGRLRNTVRVRVMNVARVTSNALALINQVAPQNMQP
ncbi:hypothetical protein QJS10_CPA10g00830 [Acorus calamus]|uniref:Pectinesterase inhibitor domain-containing protein n=1 Tax=Acorus calamus TaxID=4465 RepID=A0AAV9DZC0_ACOCL|nr:hypothetical protein QJS10_CPA10g00830 [Acorus calamus]